LLAGLPLFERQRLGRRFWYGGAWGTYSGVVGVDAPAVEAVRRRLIEIASDRGGPSLVRVHDFSGSLGVLAGWMRIEEQCQVLDLPEDPALLFRDAFTSQNRNKIRKAEKLGVQVRRGNDVTMLGRYADLYRESSERWNVSRAYPEGLFRALAGTTGVEVWLAEQGDECIAGLLNFNCGGQIMNWGNVSRRGAWGSSPNNLLHWRALEAACRAAHGPRLYNFGSSAGLPGVETFKAAFGARLRVHRRWERRAGWLALLQRLRRW